MRHRINYYYNSARDFLRKKFRRKKFKNLEKELNLLPLVIEKVQEKLMGKEEVIFTEKEVMTR